MTFYQWLMAQLGQRDDLVSDFAADAKYDPWLDKHKADYAAWKAHLAALPSVAYEAKLGLALAWREYKNLERREGMFWL